MSQGNVLYYVFSVVRILLYPLALIYGVIIWMRNKMYDSGFFSSVEFSVPVITVGNLSVGGTGKTPHIEYLVTLLQYQYRVATMSRGYKRRTQGFLLADENTNALRIGDEPMQYHMKFPELVVSVAEERMIGIPALLQKRPEVEVILLDDAYQHRSVKAGVNILITDYSRPYYKDRILPMGRLRESRGAAKRADIVIVSKCPAALSENEAAEMRNKIAPLPHQQVFFSSISYGQAYTLFNREPVELKNKHIVLVCCIARPEPLVQHLQSTAAGVHILSYPDHHYFYSKDLEEIKAAYDNWDVADKVIVTTEKDAARLHLHREKLAEMNLPIVVLPITISFLLGGQQAFDMAINRYVSHTIAANNEEPQAE